jgi:sterol desaturase/sphingolipid hydroxylase (fatty acid hydroxylase superfamily)
VDISHWLTIGIVRTAQNDWVHMNVGWQMKSLEYIFVTPRFHHIHHRVAPRDYMANTGTIFSIRDRLFGTYADPDSIRDDPSFRINTKDNPVRLVLGI